jgi:DNA-binding MarR family transcriptional regulator
MARPTTETAAATSGSRSVARVESELAALTRALEGMSRRSRIYERLDRSGYLLARTLRGRGPTTISALATELGLDATTVTRQVAAMDADGLLARSRDPHDGRACLVELTDEGVRRMEEVRVDREARIADLLRDWPDADRRTLGAMLARFNASIRDDRRA